MDRVLSPLRLGFRVCDRRYSFLRQSPGQQAGRWNRVGDEAVHYLANSPTVAWAESIRHQDITDPADLEGVAAALWAVLIPDHWSDQDLQPVNLSMELVLGTTPDAADVPEGRPGPELLPLVRREGMLLP